MKKSDLNMEVAVQVMGLGRLKIRKVPQYSSDLNEAMKVLEVMRNSGHRWLIVVSEQGYFLRRLANVTQDLDRNEKKYTADKPLGGPELPQTASQLARAICVAALEELKA